ncbi:arylesterase [Insolitispirillum peregrinum]|uniref:arylesterase n=1 Tax=Insolitispirillum peregrinum TaxID=80876 RepID=UPI00360E253F
MSLSQDYQTAALHHQHGSCSGYGSAFSPVKAGGRRTGAFFAVLLSAGLLMTSLFSPSAHAETTILALGDSLTAGYNLPAANAFPVRLQQALHDKGHAVKVINGGVSGDTTTGGLARLDWMLAEHPQVALVELGANDALRGLDPARAEANLDQILTRLKKDNIRILLIGMKAPPNLGRDYQTAFDGLYPRLAAKHQVALYPFFLDGVAVQATLLQTDGLHPTAQGVDEIVKRILPAVEPLLSPAPSSTQAKP